MVRHYKRKTVDRWSREELVQALKRIQTRELKINEAARHYGISRATLYRHFTKMVQNGGNYDVTQVRTCGGNPILTRVEEDILEKTILDLRRQGYQVTNTDIKRITFEYCEANFIPNQFRVAKRMASDDWFYGFLKRHPALGVTAKKSGVEILNEILLEGPSTSGGQAKSSKNEESVEEKPKRGKKGNGASSSSVASGKKQDQDQATTGPVLVPPETPAGHVKKPLKRLGGKGSKKGLGKRARDSTDEDSGTDSEDEELDKVLENLMKEMDKEMDLTAKPEEDEDSEEENGEKGKEVWNEKGDVSIEEVEEGEIVDTDFEGDVEEEEEPEISDHGEEAEDCTDDEDSAKGGDSVEFEVDGELDADMVYDANFLDKYLK